MSVLLLGFKQGDLSSAQIDAVREAAPRMEVLVTRERSEVESVLDDIEIAVGSFPRDLLAKAPRLRWYQQWGAGADWLLRHLEAVEAEFILTSASGVHAVPISEHILAFMFAFARQLPRALRWQAQGKWVAPKGAELLELAGKTMLLIGVGEIGARTARMASALGLRVIGVRNDPSKAEPCVDEMHGPEELAGLLPQADFVVLTVPLTAETRGMIGERELRAMPSGAYLINIGRGGTVDEDALEQALREGWIAGAGLDVFEEEPIPDGSPLWQLENLLITGHYSGSTPAYNERAMEIFLDNLRRYRAGEPLRNVVDKRRGY